MKNNAIDVRRDEPTALTAPTADSLEMYGMPAADIYETADAYVLALDMPGVAKEAISLRLDGRELIVKAALGSHHESGATIHYRELRRRGYYRTFVIGDGIDTASVDARYDLGVLTIKLYKSDAAKAREITIQ